VTTVPETKVEHGARKVVLRGRSPGVDGVMLARNCSGKPLNNLELVEHLCAVSTPLAAARRTHVHKLGALVPHVFMGDVLTRVRDCMTADTTQLRRNQRPEVVAILGVLDVAAGAADRDTRHVIAASFMRDVERETFFSELRPLLGRKLQALVGPK
jgi:hypothetical protein